MIIELLKTVPISGTILERHFEVSGRDNAWVRFDDEHGSEWVGVFGAGEPSRFFAAIPFADDGGERALVIAGGQGYLVDARSGRLLRRTSWFYSQSAIAVPDRPFVLVADDTQAWACTVAMDRPVWRRERAPYDTSDSLEAHRLALDGIVFMGATATRITGKVWDLEGWHEFTIDAATLEFARGKFISRVY